MKRIEISVSIEQMNDQEEGQILVQTPEETTSMTLSTWIGDEEPSAPAVEKLSAELARRFKYVNARKTN